MFSLCTFMFSTIIYSGIIIYVGHYQNKDFVYFYHFNSLYPNENTYTSDKNH